MRPPNCQQAFVQTKKLTGYLLSDLHDKGRHKAAALKALGFEQEHPESLEQALLHLACDAEVVETEHTAWGVKYILVGGLVGPRGSRLVRVAWIIGPGDDRPRFVTVYPARPSRGGM